MAIAPNTTKLGITVFDQAFGGIYLHKPTIICGRRKSGKFVVAMQLMAKTLLVGDRVLLFTQKTPEEVMRMVPADTLDVNGAVDNGQFLICPYSGMERAGTGPYAPLPFPQALDELSNLVKANGVTYVVFDTIVPWTAIQPLDAMQEHVDTFFSTLDGLGLTSLLLLPEPASAAALSLSTVLREVCPINIEIAAKNFGAEFTMQVTKYQGLSGASRKLPQKFALDLTPGVGFNSADAPKAKTMSDLEELETFSRTVDALKHKNVPAFRPFLTSGPATFADNGSAATDAARPNGTTPAATSAKPPSFAAAASATPPSFAAATNATPPSFAAAMNAALPSFAAAGGSSTSAPRPSTNTPPPPALDPPTPVSSGAQDGFSFASVIDLPEFQHQVKPSGRPSAKPVPTPASPPPPKTSGIQFSSVIR